MLTVSESCPSLLRRFQSPGPASRFRSGCLLIRPAGTKNQLGAGRSRRCLQPVPGRRSGAAAVRWPWLPDRTTFSLLAGRSVMLGQAIKNPGVSSICSKKRWREPPAQLRAEAEPAVRVDQVPYASRQDPLFISLESQTSDHNVFSLEHRSVLTDLQGAAVPGRGCAAETGADAAGHMRFQGELGPGPLVQNDLLNHA